jgi:hypothetical protein
VSRRIEATIGELLAAQHREVARVDERLRKRQRALVRRALTAQEDDLRRTSLGAWGTATRQRVLVMLGHGARGVTSALTADLGVGLHTVVGTSARHASRWLSTLDKAYLGVVTPQAWSTAAWAATTARDVVESRLRTFHSSFSRYGGAVVSQIETVLGTLPMGASWSDVRERIAKAARETVEDRMWMVDRIVRTETSHAYNAATQRALEAEGNTHKKLVAIFDKRTAADSYLLNGQIRPVEEPFFDGYHGRHYMHPPNRPNDREIMVGWRAAWGSDAKARGRKAKRKRVDVVEPEAVESAKERQRKMAAAFDAVKSMEATLLGQAAVPTAGLEGEPLAAAAGHNLAIAARRRAIADEKAAAARRAAGFRGVKGKQAAAAREKAAAEKRLRAEVSKEQRARQRSEDAAAKRRLASETKVAKARKKPRPA